MAHGASPRGDRRGELSSAARPARPEHVARDLLGGGRQAVIRHEGRRYLLSLTRANKLILTRDDDADA